MSINYLNNSHLGIKMGRHPFQWVAVLLQHYINSNQLLASSSIELSRYHYIPQSFQDYRETMHLAVSELNEDVFLQMIMNLPQDFELAFHSRVITMGQLYHIPMIDFGHKGSSPVESQLLKEFSSYWRMNFNIYNSGRSYHAYGNRLLTTQEWYQFMGSLLLLNKPSGFKLIDERWIGHRIMGGYSALRWSKNTSHYKKFPTYCGYLNGSELNLSI